MLLIELSISNIKLRIRSHNNKNSWDENCPWSTRIPKTWKWDSKWKNLFLSPCKQGAPFSLKMERAANYITLFKKTTCTLRNNNSSYAIKWLLPLLSNMCNSLGLLSLLKQKVALLHQRSDQQRSVMLHSPQIPFIVNNRVSMIPTAFSVVIEDRARVCRLSTYERCCVNVT